jgi:hypothetical protein
MSEFESKVNPANEGAPRRDRELNFDPERKLYIPEDVVPGYILYFFRGEPGRIAGAQRRGWEWVKQEEIDGYLPAFRVGSDFGKDSGSTDMGDRVSVPAQEGVGPSGQYLRLYLMKLKKEFWDEDMENYIKKRIQPVVDSFLSGTVGAEGNPAEINADRQMRYTKKGVVPDMFKRKQKA